MRTLGSSTPRVGTRRGLEGVRGARGSVVAARARGDARQTHSDGEDPSGVKTCGEGRRECRVRGAKGADLRGAGRGRALWECRGGGREGRGGAPFIGRSPGEGARTEVRYGGAGGPRV